MKKQHRRNQVIDEAKKLINGDRKDQYGESSFQSLARMWSVYLGHEITPAQSAEMLAILKIIRNKNKPKLDSFIDGIGYLALAAEEAFGNDPDL
jgi:hypothetical protein